MKYVISLNHRHAPTDFRAGGYWTDDLNRAMMYDTPSEALADAAVLTRTFRYELSSKATKVERIQIRAVEVANMPTYRLVTEGK